ncbi:hypothetical protein BK634_21510 [Pseudomonas chlororaphis]|nr:hypothetical protein BK634_21510 [Pseudomonas chlororaphis]
MGRAWLEVSEDCGAITILQMQDDRVFLHQRCSQAEFAALQRRYLLGLPMFSPRETPRKIDEFFRPR